MLKVTVDIERGAYIIRRDGEKGEVVVQPMEHQYDRKKLKAKRDAIEKARRWIPTDKKKLIDVGVYEAMQEFDRQFGTEYAEKYIDATIHQIPYTSLGEKSRDRQKRSREIRAKEFSDAGIEVEYNVSLFKGWGNLGFNDRIQAIRLAFAQKQNGIKVNTFMGKQQLLVTPEVKVVERMEDLPGMEGEKPAEPVQQPIQVQEPVQVEQQEQAPVPPVQTNQILRQPEPKRIILALDEDDIPPMPDQETLRKMQEEDEKIRQAKQQQAEEETRKQEEARLKTETEKEKVVQKMEPKPKKAIKRCKARQMAKNEQRAAGQLQNRYTGMITAKEERRTRREASVGLAKKEPKPQPVQTPVAKKKKPVARTVALAKNGSKAHKEGFVTRFTRKLKDRADSVRKKIRAPQLTDKQKAIAGAVTAVALVGTIAVGTYALVSNSRAQRPANDAQTVPSKPTATETVTPQPMSHIEKESFILEESQAPVVSETPIVQTPEIKEPENRGTQIVETDITPAGQEENGGNGGGSGIDEDSGIRVGGTIEINSGNFFVRPEGIIVDALKEHPGDFRGYTDQTKIVEFIDVMIPGKPYIPVSNPNISLEELKQQYPDAKFSFHIVRQNEDGTTSALGFLTEEQYEQIKENESKQVEQGVQQQYEIDDDEER